MVMDYTAPRYDRGDVVKIKGKALPFKITEVLEEDGKILYLVKQIQEYIVEDEQIVKLINQK
jgi:hypothetical protein